MATAPADNNKYEILEKIGNTNASRESLVHLFMIGHGSFGVIRKVRRKADAKVTFCPYRVHAKTLMQQHRYNVAKRSITSKCR